jgi:hypothetical protein
MATIPSQFQDAYNVNRFLLVSGTATPIQFPSLECKMVRFKAHPANNEDFYLGVEGVTDFPLDAGDDTGWINAYNLNQFYYSNVSGTAERLTCWWQV